MKRKMIPIEAKIKVIEKKQRSSITKSWLYVKTNSHIPVQIELEKRVKLQVENIKNEG